MLLFIELDTDKLEIDEEFNFKLFLEFWTEFDVEIVLVTELLLIYLLDDRFVLWEELLFVPWVELELLPVLPIDKFGVMLICSEL